MARWILAAALCVAFANHVAGFRAAGLSGASTARRAGMRTLRMAEGTGAAAHTLVVVRHGESTWNSEGLFTGWVDCPLSDKGRNEAKEAARTIREAGFEFDIAYTSVLKRAISTLWILLEELDLMWIPVVRCWRLNERHYGGLQGLDKKQTVAKHGTEQVQIWRRSYDIPPPELDESSEYHPINDRKYKDVAKDQLPKSESLMLTEKRFMVEWEETIAPMIKTGKRVVIAAHGNSLRALVKHLDDIPSDVIPGINIPTGVPLVYELDANLKPVKSDKAAAPLSGYYLGNADEVAARIQGVLDQTAAAK